MRRATFVAAFLALAATGYGGERRPGREVSSRRPAESGSWRSGSSENFDVYGAARENELKNWTQSLERLRQELGAKWLDRDRLSAWTPRCIVVLHPSAESYSKAVPGGESTAGSSLFEDRGENGLLRRIDVRPAPFEMLRGTLAHELVHMLVGERFRKELAPAWGEEGMAVLEDSAEIRRLHRANLLVAVRQRRVLSLPELFGSGPGRSLELEPLFYAQSASVAEFLVQRASPSVFVRFLDAALERGYDAALREVYGFDNVEQLQHHWRRSLSDWSATGTPTGEGGG